MDASDSDSDFTGWLVQGGVDHLLCAQSQREQQSSAAAAENCNEVEEDSAPAEPDESHEWDLMLDSMLESLNSSSAEGISQSHVVSETTSDSLTHISETMFGKPRDIERMGTAIQKNMFSAFLRAVEGDKRRGSSSILQQQTLEDALAEQFVIKSSYSSQVQEAENIEQAGGGKSLTRNLSEYSSALLFGGAFLTGAFLTAWGSLFVQKKIVPIAVFSKLKYDETPLKMRVQEANTFFNHESWENVSTRQVRSKDMIAEITYVAAKIQRIEWTFSDLTQETFAFTLYIVFCLQFGLMQCNVM
jgi:hypothetical protein